MASSTATFLDKVRIIHDADGWHYSQVAYDEASNSALIRCDGCGAMLIVTPYTEPQEPTQSEPQQAESQPDIVESATGLALTKPSRSRKKDKSSDS